MKALLPRLQTPSGSVILKSEVEDDLVVIFAIWANRTIGRLTGLLGNSLTAHLQDVVVEDSMPIKRGLLDRLVGRTRARSFRGQGIGSKLLTEFLTICRRRGVTQVIGAVVQRDMDATPGLLNWYALHGFQKRAPSESPLPERYRPPNTVWEVVWNPPVPASE
jgi:GNAT superfamily N-acetyltransferase